MAPTSITTGQTQTIHHMLDDTMTMLLKIDDQRLIQRQRYERGSWDGRIKCCGKKVEDFTRGWNRPGQPSEKVVGETLRESVTFLHKRTKEFYDHLEYYAQFYERLDKEEGIKDAGM